MLRIGELSRRVGVSTELLRAWERRYGLLSPTRTAGGFRLYGDERRARAAHARPPRLGRLGRRRARAWLLERGEPPGTRPPACDSARVSCRRRSTASTRRRARGARPAARAVDARDGPARRRPALPPRARRALAARRGLGRAGALRERPPARPPARPRSRLGHGGAPLALLACVPGDQHDLGLIASGSRCAHAAGASPTSARTRRSTPSADGAPARAGARRRDRRDADRVRPGRSELRELASARSRSAARRERAVVDAAGAVPRRRSGTRDRVADVRRRPGERGRLDAPLLTAGARSSDPPSGRCVRSSA